MTGTRLFDELGEGPAVMLVHAGIADRRMWHDELLISAPGLEPSGRLQAAWAAEEEATERGDIDGAVDAVLSAWLDPSAPADLRDRVGAMQRQAFELESSGEMPQPDDPLDGHPERVSDVDVPALVAAGEHDMPGFLWSARRLAETLPHATHHVIAEAGHLAPLEAPEAFRALVGAFLASVD